MNQYLIPANANRGKLILGYFKLFDIILFGTGIVTTFLLLLIFQSSLGDLLMVVLVLAPALITGLLVMPIPYQHNVREFLKIMYRFFMVNRKNYYWKGWCEKYGDETTDGK